MNLVTRSTPLQLAYSAIGVGLFAGATAHDVHVAVRAYEAGQPDRIFIFL